MKALDNNGNIRVNLTLDEDDSKVLLDVQASLQSHFRKRYSFAEIMRLALRKYAKSVK